MHKFAKATTAAGACLVLTGCIVVGKATEGVKTAEGDVRTWQSLEPGTRVTVPAGGSITIVYDPVSPKQCERTYTRDFVVPSSCKDDDNDDQRRQDDREQNKDQENPPEQQGQSQGNPPEQQGRQPESGQGHGQPDTSPQAPGGGGGGGGGSGIGGPQVVATAAPGYSNFMPIVQNTLTVIGALAVAKEVHDQTNGDSKPVSR